MRLAPLDAISPMLLDFNTSRDVRGMQPGAQVTAVGTDFDLTANVSNWGVAELIYVSSNAAAVIPPGSLVYLDKNFRIQLTAVAATEANQGKPLYVALTNFQIGSVTEQYGWVLRSGMCPVAYSVAATAGKVFLGTAGKATPTAAAGVQLLNAQCITAAVATFARSGYTRVGSSIVKFANVGGMFIGQAISGTGIPASSVISAIGADGTSVYIGSAVGTLVTATATGLQTVTMTNTGFGICQIDRALSQGQIT